MTKNFGLDDVKSQLDNALNLLNSTTKGLPERIAALKDIKQDEIELLQKGLDKVNQVMGDIGTEMKDLDSFLKK